MSSGHEMAIYLVGAASCVLVVLLVLRWAQPVDGKLSPKLRRPGMEILVVGFACLVAVGGLGLTIGAILVLLRLAGNG